MKLATFLLLILVGLAFLSTGVEGIEISKAVEARDHICFYDSLSNYKEYVYCVTFFNRF